MPLHRRNPAEEAACSVLAEWLRQECPVYSPNRSLHKLAAQAGVCRATLYYWLKGRSPTVATLAKVLRPLGYKLVIQPLSKEELTANGDEY